MGLADCEIAPYDSAWGQQVAELMVHLWGADVQANLAYLRWKYEGNPYAEQPLALVALHQGQVVSFRGYSPLPFRVAGTGDALIVLCPGDTCVHPDQRMAGLSVRMGKAALRAYAGRYRLLMNWSCTKSSLPGYRKMGFLALTEKTYLTRAGPLGTLRYLLAVKAVRPAAQSCVRYGRTGNLVIASAPRVGEMAALARREEAVPGTLVLCRDEAFLVWRFASPRGRYVFYYLLQDNAMVGYLAVGLSPNNRRAFLLDYGEAEPGRLAEILRSILQMRHFDVLSVYTFGLTAGQRRMLEKLGFGVAGLITFLETRQKGRIPLLVRPVKETFGDEDLLVHGIDVRRIEHWSLKPIGSDAS